MNTRKVNIIALITALLMLSACSTTDTQHSSSSGGRPILSAAEADSMIRVEVRTLEPVPVEQAMVDTAKISIR